MVPCAGHVMQLPQHVCTRTLSRFYAIETSLQVACL
jgi:hypothetical protein